MRRRLLGIVVLAAVVAVLLASAPGAVAQGPVTGILTGPNALGPGAIGVFFLNVSGGPASEAPGNVSVSAYITGSDVTGGAPLQATPHRQTTNGTGPFMFNITAPQKEQVITVVAEITSAAGSRAETATVSTRVTVIVPIVFTATFRNAGGAAAVDVPVKFFIDGRIAGATNISRIDPATSGTAKLTYLPVGLTPGTHTVRAEADLNRNGVIEPEKGEVAVFDVFYKKDFELTWPWAILIMLITVSLSFLVIRSRRRRR